MRDGQRRSRGALAGLGVALIVLTVLAGCSGEPPAPAAESDRGRTDVYFVRGVVTDLPSADDPSHKFRVHHEAVPDLKDADGTVVGMDSMTMAFPLADPSLAEGLSVGDKIEMRYEVEWSPGPAYRVTDVRRLAPETELDFGDEAR